MYRCCSYIGYIGCGRQGVSLAHPCITAGTVIHELLHSLGFYHEHSRPDRDQYIRVINQNIQQGAKENFRKFGTESINSLGIEYDFNSIMHYCENSFSVSKDKNTLQTHDPNATILCNGCELSPLDILQINLLYQCGQWKRLIFEIFFCNIIDCLWPADIANHPPISTPSPPELLLPSLTLPFSKCGKIFDGKLEGKFSSPGFDTGKYPHNQKCGWVFRARKGFRIKIKLTVSIEFISGCTKDYIQGKSVSRYTRKYCGEYSLTFSSVTEYSIHLLTDGSNRASSRTYRGITGTFTSDGTDYHYIFP